MLEPSLELFGITAAQHDRGQQQLDDRERDAPGDRLIRLGVDVHVPVEAEREAGRRQYGQRDRDGHNQVRHVDEFTAPAGPVPLGISDGTTMLQGYWQIPQGNIWADGSSPQGQALFNAQYAMVYNLGGQNAGYWFGGM
jgi:hypothetical protein